MPNNFDNRHLVTFGDTNVVGNVYFANYFRWMGECREAIMALYYPEFEEDLRRGFGLITEFAHIDYHQEARLFDSVVVRLTITSLSRTRVEFAFEFIRAKDQELLAKGRQAVVWVNAQKRPALMPDKMYDGIVSHFGITEGS
jgi:enediyne biosynthesis thioesterase